MRIETIEPKDIFKHVCFHPRPKAYLRALKIYGHNKQLLANVEFVETNTQINTICGWCGKVITADTFDYFAGYWTPNLWRPTHKECKKEYKAFETIECQKIDADCNDCKHFERLKSLGIGIASGNCKKFNHETKAYSNFARGMECFEHRRSV